MLPHWSNVSDTAPCAVVRFDQCWIVIFHLFRSSTNTGIDIIIPFRSFQPDVAYASDYLLKTD